MSKASSPAAGDSEPRQSALGAVASSSTSNRARSDPSSAARVPMTTRAPESASWYSASSGVNAGLTGVATAPIRHAAINVTRSSIRLGRKVATTSPGRTPARPSCSATPSTRRAKPA